MRRVKVSNLSVIIHGPGLANQCITALPTLQLRRTHMIIIKNPNILMTGLYSLLHLYQQIIISPRSFMYMRIIFIKYSILHFFLIFVIRRNFCLIAYTKPFYFLCYQLLNFMASRLCHSLVPLKLRGAIMPT
jgi:hypothetical protein